MWRDEHRTRFTSTECRLLVKVNGRSDYRKWTQRLPRGMGVPRRREIAAIEAEILAGNSDLRGLCLALADWSTELRILQRELRAHEDSQQDREAGG